MNKTNTVLGIDIGGSFIKAGLVDISSGKLVSDPLRIIISDKPNYENVTHQLYDIINQNMHTTSVGIGYPGVVKNGIVSPAAHLTDGWAYKNLSSLWSHEFAKTISVINDADAAGIAEMKFGAGQKMNNSGGGTVAVITLGTGIGTALFHNGLLFPNCELGHIYYATGEESEAVAAASVKTKENLSWAEYGKRVNRYLNYLNDLLTIDCFIIGGGISGEFELFKNYIDLSSEVLPASFQNSAGLIGAALATEK